MIILICLLLIFGSRQVCFIFFLLNFFIFDNQISSPGQYLSFKQFNKINKRLQKLQQLNFYIGTLKQFQITGMKASLKHDTKSSYLDVTQFILKECSPLIKPASPKPNFHEQKYQKTPQINPIDHDPSKFSMTPLCTGLCGPQIFDFVEQFNLDSVQGFSLQYKNQSRPKQHKIKQSKPKSNCILELLQSEQILNMIPEMENQDDMNLYYQEYDEQSEYYSDYSYTDSQEFYRSTYKQEQVQKQSTIDISAIQFNDAIQRFRQNPKREIIKQMKQIQNTMPQQTQDSKKLMIKKLIEKYLLDYETYCYEQAWKQLEQYELNDMIKKITQGLAQTFSKKIGQLPFQVRRTKILKYLQKKKKRIWRKKVSYDCRKKVADGRLRIKGKFVTRQQACQQLGVQSLQGYTSEQIKYMLQRRLDGKDMEH